MIDKNILTFNLNDQVSYEQFFGAFGYKPDDKLFLRLFYDPEKRYGIKERCTPEELDNTGSGAFGKIKRLNDQKNGVFFVVNGGGDSDKQVIDSGGPARAQFMEIDPDKKDLERVKAGEITIEELLEQQIAALNQFPLVPSVIVRTWKSLHVYWLLIDGDILRFRNIQQQLISIYESDTTIQNESRVMRIPGFYHCKNDPPVLVKLIKFDPDLRYTQDQIQEALTAETRRRYEEAIRQPGSGAALITPAAPEIRTKAAPEVTRAEGELIKKGNGRRYAYCVGLCGSLVCKLKNTVSAEAILAMVYAEFRKNCEDPDDIDGDFGKTYYPVIVKFQKRILEETPEDWKYNLRAWEAEHPGQRFDKAIASWDDVRMAGWRARDEGKRFDLGTVADGSAEPGAEQPEPGESAARSLTEIFGASSFVEVNADCHEEIPKKDWVVEGLCTRGECAIVSGSSKSGKSYLMTNLAIAIASGAVWLGRFQCKRSRVLYLNGENQINDARARFHAVFESMGADPDQCERITMICADGVMESMQQLKDGLINEIRSKDYGVVLLDPLYCFYKGSELDEEAAKAFVEAIKEVCRETGAVIFCVHHHSKGAAMYKNASSRASGSGMLQRAFSTLLDISEIDSTEIRLPEGQRGYEFTGEPRQAAGFKTNLIFEFPLWRADTQKLLPDNARNKGRTAAARGKNGNIAKAAEIDRALPEVLERAFKEYGKSDSDGDYITSGDVVREFEDLGVEISERAIERHIDDGIAEYTRDPQSGRRRFIRKVGFAPAAEARIADIGLSAAPDPQLEKCSI